jgi:phosphoribosyl 1,2-cyclic phosphodiesterase
VKIRFWGSRGSIPVSITATDIRAKLVTALRAARGLSLQNDGDIDSFVDRLGFDIAGTFGGHSSCIELATDCSEHLILDMGSGARPLGQDMIRRFGPTVPQTYHVFMSHLHWDHIMGFPFFTPAYIPGNRIVIHSCHEEVEHAFRRQQGSPSFPVEFDQLSASIEFDVMCTDTDHPFAGLTVRAKRQNHAGDSYGWRFSDGHHSVVYSTDSEHRVEDLVAREGFIDFFRDADAVIFDAMYSLADSISVKADWGHSSNVVGVELCQAANAKRLIMFHHEPSYDDSTIAGVLAETRRYEEITREGSMLEVLSAWDGLIVSL